ncbi:hypothetical protein EVAR_18965_1 [Eumeta japonica]|uniref:Uncharacterized protein n=1 Tax=Eumeta variegata TaxID=151549 RepID=A0A4C1X017_EUMVA|nr:hypothetical protein EVAR_18965_1 [Eumeta japonica]
METPRVTPVTKTRPGAARPADRCRREQVRGRAHPGPARTAAHRAALAPCHGNKDSVDLLFAFVAYSSPYSDRRPGGAAPAPRSRRNVCSVHVPARRWSVRLSQLVAHDVALSPDCVSDNVCAMLAPLARGSEPLTMLTTFGVDSVAASARQTFFLFAQPRLMDMLCFGLLIQLVSRCTPRVSQKASLFR